MAREDMLEERPKGGRLGLEEGLVPGVVGLVEEAEQRFEAAPPGARRLIDIASGEIEKDDGAFGQGQKLEVGGGGGRGGAFSWQSFSPTVCWQGP
jgi:hypothetical protein